MAKSLILISVKDNPDCDARLFPSLQIEHRKKNDIAVLLVDEPQIENLKIEWQLETSKQEPTEKELEALEAKALRFGDESWERNKEKILRFLKQFNQRQPIELTGDTISKQISLFNAKAQQLKAMITIYRWKDWLNICDSEKIKNTFNDTYEKDPRLKTSFLETARDRAQRKSKINDSNDPVYQKYYKAAISYLIAEVPYIFFGCMELSIEKIIYPGDKSKFFTTLRQIALEKKENPPQWINSKENIQPSDDYTPNFFKKYIGQIHTFIKIKSDMESITETILASIYTGLVFLNSPTLQAKKWCEIYAELQNILEHHQQKNSITPVIPPLSDSIIPEMLKKLRCTDNSTDFPKWEPKYFPYVIASKTFNLDKKVKKNATRMSKIIYNLVKHGTLSKGTATFIATGISEALHQHKQLDFTATIKTLMEKLEASIEPSNTQIVHTQSGNVPSIADYSQHRI